MCSAWRKCSESTEFFGDPTGNSVPSILCNQQDAEAWAVFGDVSWERHRPAHARCRRALDGGEKGVDWPAAGLGRSNHRRIELGRLRRAPRPRRLRRTDWPGNAGVRSDEEPGPNLRTRACRLPVTDDINSYLRYDRGFKSGGYNDQTGTATVILDAFLAPYDPEFADSYEAGLKTSWLENRLRLNGAIFYVDYTDAQRALVTRVCVPSTQVVSFCDDGVTQGRQFQETRFLMPRT
jgi:iron complex outermembrane receptor protein